jgi:hypothetical protein
MLTENDARERMSHLAQRESTENGLSALVAQIAERAAEKLGLWGVGPVEQSADITLACFAPAWLLPPTTG